MILSHRGLGLSGGVLVCNPIPESDALETAEVEGWITKALEMASAQEITGKALTPFLLSTLATLSKGKTLPANKALAINNARVAARLAIEMRRRRQQTT